MRFFKKAPERGSGIGRPIFTADGEKLGEVKEIEAGGIRVRVTLGKDYWLARRDVEADDEDRVVLAFRKDELDEYKRDEAPPESVPEGIPYTTAAIISDEEQAHMREKMERELEEQRQRLRDN